MIIIENILWSWVSYHDFWEPVISHRENTKIQFGELNLPWYRSCDKRKNISSLSECKFLPFCSNKLGCFVKQQNYLCKIDYLSLFRLKYNFVLFLFFSTAISYSSYFVRQIFWIHSDIFLIFEAWEAEFGQKSDIWTTSQNPQPIMYAIGYSRNGTILGSIISFIITLLSKYTNSCD